MKKYFYTLLTTLIAVTTTMTIVSCSADEDIDDSSKILSCPDNHHPHMIDLGLPSGTLWACCNVGADEPEAYGGYYAWGETEEKSEYNHVTYLYSTGVDEDGDGWYDDHNSPSGSKSIWQNLGSDIAGSEYDVAHVKWGGYWVMPSISQFKELMKYCTYAWTSLNGVDGGGLFTGPSGRSVFFPAELYPGQDFFLLDGSLGKQRIYWSSSTQKPLLEDDAFGFHFRLDEVVFINGGFGRSTGRMVRPVISGTANINSNGNHN